MDLHVFPLPPNPIPLGHPSAPAPSTCNTETFKTFLLLNKMHIQKILQASVYDLTIYCKKNIYVLLAQVRKSEHRLDSRGHHRSLSKHESEVLVTQLCPTLCATPWPVACQAPLSMEFSRQEYWSG